MHGDHVATYRSLVAAALRIGVTDEERSAAFLADIEAPHGTDSDYGLGPLIVSVWKRKTSNTGR